MIGWLTDDRVLAVNVVVVTGKGGIGKTALAIRSAHQLSAQFPDGQLYVNLRGAEAQRLDPDEVLADFLGALGVARTAIPDSLDGRVDLYRTRLHNRRTLVVLDNAASEEQVRPLLPGWPQCGVLITSRARLSGLDSVRVLSLGELGPGEAVALLDSVAGPGRVQAEGAAAARIVELCGYLPLAVRIAGAKLAARPQWRLARLVERLEDERGRLDELAIGDREVRASFLLSFVGRPDDEQQVFRMLGLLKAADFTTWVVAALLEADLDHATELVERLVDAQLLEVVREDATGQIRYRFHDLLRLLAREELQKVDVETRHAALERMVGAYLALAEGAEARLGPGSLHEVGRGGALRWPAGGLSISQVLLRDPLLWLTVERVNLLAVLEQAYEAELWEQTYELAASLERFFIWQTHLTESRRAKELALAAARRAGNRRAEADVLRSFGGAYLNAGNWDRASEYLTQAASIFSNIGDELGEAESQLGLGVVYRDEGRFDEALACYERCLPVFRGLGDRLKEASIVHNMGITYREQGRWTDALACFEQCLPVFRAFDDDVAEARALHSTGVVHRYRLDYDGALQYFQTALPMFDKVGDRRWEGITLLAIGRVYYHQGRRGETLPLFEQCLRIFSELGDSPGEAHTLRSIGLLHRDEGRLADGVACLEQALAIFAKLNDRRGTARILHSLGVARGRERRFEDALRYLDQSLVGFRELRDRPWQARTLRAQGSVLASCGDRPAAIQTWRQALDIFRDLSAPQATQLEAWLNEL